MPVLPIVHPFVLLDIVILNMHTSTIMVQITISVTQKALSSTLDDNRFQLWSILPQMIEPALFLFQLHKLCIMASCLHVEPDEFLISIRWWLGLGILHGSQCALLVILNKIIKKRAWVWCYFLPLKTYIYLDWGISYATFVSRDGIGSDFLSQGQNTL